MAFDLVIFDCDGVLVDSEVISCASLADQLTAAGLPTSHEEVMARFLGRSTAAIAEDFRARTGSELPEEFLPRFRLDVAERMRRELLPIPDIQGVLEGLRSLGLPFCVASSSERPRLDLALTLTGLIDFFDARIFNAAMVARGKPAPDLFLHAAQTLGADPARCLVIEDSPAGVLAGKAAGMTVWGFTGGSHQRAGSAETLVKAGADRLFNRMQEFDVPEFTRNHGQQRHRQVAPR